MSEHRHCACGRVVAHNLQLQAENESLTRRLAAQIESAERMARERAADVAKLREDNKKLRAYVAAWGGVAYWRELARRNEIAG